MSISKGQFVALTVVLAAATMGTAGYLAYSSQTPAHGAQQGSAVGPGGGSGGGGSQNGGASGGSGGSTGSGGGSGSGESSSSTSALAKCRGDQIQVGVGKQQAGLGHVGVVLVFQNTSQSACALGGYPGAAAVGSTGVTHNAARSEKGYLGAAPITRVRVDAGGYASAVVEWTDGTGAASTSGCVNTSSLSVTPPNTTVTSTVALGSLAQICADFQVHPVVAGQAGSASAG